MKHDIKRALVTQLCCTQGPGGGSHSLKATHGPVPGITDPLRNNPDHLFNTEFPVSREAWERIMNMWAEHGKDAILGVDLAHTGDRGQDWTVRAFYLGGELIGSEKFR